jgi:hypothetical protein
VGNFIAAGRSSQRHVCVPFRDEWHSDDEREGSMGPGRMEPYSLSGVPLVLDRLGIVDPLAAPRGFLFGVALALLIWTAILAVMI